MLIEVGHERDGCQLRETVGEAISEYVRGQFLNQDDRTINKDHDDEEAQIDLNEISPDRFISTDINKSEMPMISFSFVVMKRIIDSLYFFFCYSMIFHSILSGDPHKCLVRVVIAFRVRDDLNSRAFNIEEK